MNICIIVEGRTEKVFMPFLRMYLEKILVGKMPRLNALPYDGPIPKGEKLKRHVRILLSGRNRNAADYVLALTDVYTGSKPSDFIDADDAKKKMREWVGYEPRFFPHAAQYDFEAWLLPYWATIQALTHQENAAPAKNPETVNHTKPPSYHIKEIYRRDGYGYSKTRDAPRILRDQDLSIAVEQCSELKAFVNTIISVCNS